MAKLKTCKEIFMDFTVLSDNLISLNIESAFKSLIIIINNFSEINSDK